VLTEIPGNPAREGDNYSDLFKPSTTQLIAKIRSDIDDVRDDVIGVYQLICK